MQAHAPLPPPPHRSPDNHSPLSATGSDWSGMNNYNNGGLRPDFHPPPPPRGDSMSAPDGDFDPRPPHRAQTFAAGSPTDHPSERRGLSQDGSRASSRAGSSRTSDISLRDPRSQRYQRAESELRQHYAVLRAYLKGGASQPPRTNKARDKLLRLSPVQFHELSTDVFDELQRRQASQPLPGRPPRPDKVPPFLQARSDFHEKRNQARQKLSSLQTSRFRDLSTDVFCELERRFPHFNPDFRRESVRSQSRGPGGRGPGPNGFGPPGRAHTAQVSISSNAGFPPRKGSMAPLDVTGANELGRPMPKQFQSNTITPNKSTMVEDEDDDDPMSRYDRSSEAFGLESNLTSPRSNRDTSATSISGRSNSKYPPPEELQQKIAELEQRLEAKDAEIKRLSTAVSGQSELQEKLDAVEKLNQQMKDELERIKSGQSEGEAEWKTRHQQLEVQHRSLQKDYDRQRQTTEEVKQQFQSHLADMRALADESTGHMQREEQLHSELQKLRDEAAAWKARYTKAKTQLKTVRASTIGLNIASAHVLHDQTFFASDGLIRDVHVTKFQVSIDELLAVARTQEPSAVLDPIKDLVTAVRSITGDVDRVMQTPTDDASRKQKKLQAKVSTTANNVITASKNYAAAQGLSPVSLLDAAASHLTAAVVDLIRTVKIRPTPPGELADDSPRHMTPVNQNGYFHLGDLVRRPSNADSVYSALSDPADPDSRTPVMGSHEHTYTNGEGFNGLGINAGQLRVDDAELEELKIYVGNQTDSLVQHIQSLVGSVRNEEPMSRIRNHANTILDVVDGILGAVEGGMDQPNSWQTAFANAAHQGYSSLTKCKGQLEKAAQDSVQHDGMAAAKDFGQSLPPLAFQIAREAKDLTARIESVTAGGDAEDFS